MRKDQTVLQSSFLKAWKLISKREVQEIRNCSYYAISSFCKKNWSSQKQNKKNNKKVVPDVLVTNCNPCLKGLRKRIIKYWDKTQITKYAKKKIFTTFQMVAYSKYRNIGYLILRSILKSHEIQRDLLINA